MAELAALLGIHIYMEEWVALEPNYPEEKRAYIVDMLQSFRIAYRWKNGKGMVVPTSINPNYSSKMQKSSLV